MQLVELAEQIVSSSSARLASADRTASSSGHASAPGPAQVVGADLVAAVAVEAKAGARRLAVLLVDADDLHQALEAAEERRRLAAQVDQHLVVHEPARDVIDDHRRDRRERSMRAAMRQEADGRLRPQQSGSTRSVVSSSGVRIITRMPRASALPASVQAVWSLFDVGVEVDLRHSGSAINYRLASSSVQLGRLSRYPPRAHQKLVSIGTGRPVEPLSLARFPGGAGDVEMRPLNFLAKRARKQAAVTLPAGRPPMLAMSANGLLICSW